MPSTAQRRDRVRHIGSAVLCAAVAWCGPAAADSSNIQHVIELDGERWRAVGALTSSITGAKIVIFQEEASRRSKIANSDAPPFQGVLIRAVENGVVWLEVEGRAVRLALGRGSGASQGRVTPAGSPTADPQPKPPLAFARVRLTVAEYRDSAVVLRQAFQSGDIGLGHNDQGIFGVVVNESPPGGILERLGLQTGDVVVAINGTPAASEDAALALLDAVEADRRIPFAFRRGAEVGQGVVEVVDDPS